MWTKYLQLVLVPGTLSADYSYDGFPVSTSLLDPRAVASIVVLVAIAAAGWRSWRQGGRLGLGLAWAAVALLPVSHLVPFRELLAEHYLYVPMMGVALAVTGVVDGAARRWPARQRWLAAATAVAVAALATRTVVRNRDWRDRITLWSATVAVVPRCARAQYNLGQALFERSRLQEAERAWLASAALQPDDKETTRGLAMLYYRLGRHELAATKIEAVLAASPSDGDALTFPVHHARSVSERAAAYFAGALAAAARRPSRRGAARAPSATGTRPAGAS